MGVLDQVLAYKKQKDAEATADISAIPQAAMLYQQAKQQQFENQIKNFTLQVGMAEKGYAIKDGRLVRDESLISPTDRFLQQGKLAEAHNSILLAGGVSPYGASMGGVGTSQSPSIPLPASKLSETKTVSTKPNDKSDMFVTQANLNVAGQPTATTVKSESGMRREIASKAEESKLTKMAEAQGKTQQSASEQSTASLRFVQQFERSYDEISKAIPGFDQPGLGGKASRIGATVKEKMDELPETSTLIRSLKVFANRMVKVDEGGKVTDKDRETYAETLANTLSAPSDTNARLSSNELISLADKGAGIDDNLVAFASSKNPVLNKIYSQVIEQYPELKVVTIKNPESGETRKVTLKQARELRGSK